MEIDPLSAIMCNWGPLDVSHLPSCLALHSCRYRGRSRLYVARGSFRINWKVFLEPVLKAAGKARLTMRRKEKPFLLGKRWRACSSMPSCQHVQTEVGLCGGQKNVSHCYGQSHLCSLLLARKVQPCRTPLLYVVRRSGSQRVNLLSWIDIVSPASLQCNLPLPVVLAQHHLSVLIVVSDVSTLQKPAQHLKMDSIPPGPSVLIWARSRTALEWTVTATPMADALGWGLNMLSDDLDASLLNNMLIPRWSSGQGISIRLQAALQYCLEGSMCADQVGECNVVQGKLVLVLE